MSTENLLEIKNLCIDFKTDEGTVQAVKNLNLVIKKGQTLGLVGESGSGKSVTSLAIMRLIPNPPGSISSGEILFKGTNLLNLSADEMRKMRGNRISMIFQEPMTSLNPVYSVGDQIDEALMLHKGLTKKQARSRTLELLQEVGIPEFQSKVNSYPHELSGGQKQRIMIAMSMSCEPELLICDEPTTALDVTIQKQVLELMINLQKKHQMSMLFITHDLGVVADMADQVAVMYKGEVVENKSAKELFTMPTHPYTKGLLACRPNLNTKPRRLLTVSDFLAKEAEGKSIDASKVPQKVIKEIKENEVPLLEVRNLKKYFPIKSGLFSKTTNFHKAVDDVSLRVFKGRTLGLVGESGCGKTTLGRTILRLIEATEGSVLYQGTSIFDLTESEMRKMRRKMQIIFQDPYSSLNPRMTVESILTEPLLIHDIGATKAERVDRAAYLLEKVGLEKKHLSRYPHEFSGGQRQRICIARALTLNPEFIICDESVSALDVSVQAQVLNLLQDLQDEFNLTYIFISHDLSVVKYISDEVGVMNGGKIVEYATSDEIYLRPKSQYTKSLLSAIPKGMPKELSL
jgi:peptide/nickel transport system ATP-binding protein